MRNPRLYAAKLNSMPKLEFAISESPTKPARAANSLICLLLFLHPSSFLRAICRLSRVSIANTKSWFQSWCISRSRRTAKFRSEVRSGFASVKWIAGYRARERSPPFSLFTFSFFFFSCSLRTCGKQKAGSSAAPHRLPPDWRGCINIMQISGAALLHRARTRETVTFLLSVARPRRSTRKVSLLISTKICATRVSPLSLRDSWHFAYAA